MSAILESDKKVSEDDETGVGGCEAVTGEGGSGGGGGASAGASRSGGGTGVLVWVFTGVI